MYPKARLDALTDGLFGVAMTILVLDVRLPDDFHPRDHGALFRALIDLWPKFFPYALSFFVLGIRWLSSVQMKTKSEVVSTEYARWWLLYLFLITCVPFATILVGRFPDEAPAICFYRNHGVDRGGRMANDGVVARPGAGTTHPGSSIRPHRAVCIIGYCDHREFHIATSGDVGFCSQYRLTDFGPPDAVNGSNRPPRGLITQPGAFA